MESTLKNMILTLFIITLVGSAAVGIVYRMTTDPIAIAKSAKITDAISKVVPQFDNDPSASKKVETVDGREITIYTAKMGDAPVGYAIETFSNNGFGGLVKLMVGILPDGTISKIEVLQHNETPGLGDKMDSAKSDFSVQFEGKNPADFKLTVKKDGGDVDAITASTISSRAYCDAVDRAYKVFQNIEK